MARRRFFVDSIRNGAAVIAGEDARHLARVLRAQPGQQFELSDNRSVYLAEVTEIGKDRVSFRVLQSVDHPPPAVRVALVASLIKFDRFEWMVEKATELGVGIILPVESGRSERGLLRAARKRVERWRRIAREASQQARRVTIPEVGAPQRLEDLAVDSFAPRLVLDEMPGASPLRKNLPLEAPPGTIAILTGPEGGWTAVERERLAAGWIPVSLGPQILRAETAALAALAVLVNYYN